MEEKQRKVLENAVEESQNPEKDWYWHQIASLEDKNLIAPSKNASRVTAVAERVAVQI